MAASGRSGGEGRDDRERVAAIEAVLTLEPWRSLMRRLPPLLALLFVTPALAETLDCALIKSTTRPFELTYDWTRTADGKDPLAVQMRHETFH